MEPKATATKPSPPAERNPPQDAGVSLPEGRASERPRAKVPPPPNPQAADVPMQAWKQNDRASLDDPTADLSAVRVIDTPLPVSRGVLPFLRLSIPDPFELVEQMKGKLGRDTELGTGPIK
jgi:hypothetical protein